MARFAFVLGKPPRAGTLLRDVMTALERRGHRVHLELPHELPAGTTPRFDPDGVDLVVQRGLRTSVLASLRAVEAEGVRVCNPVAAALGLRDRFGLAQRLAAAGLPVPRTERCAEWSQVRDVVVATGSVVVKARTLGAGRAAEVAVVTRSDVEPPFAGPWVVQELVRHAGVDEKLYVAGPHVARRRSASPLTVLADRAPVTAADAAAGAGSDLVALATRVGHDLGLDVYGVDVVVGPAGPQIVDVNEFPGFRGIPHSSEPVTALIEQLTEVRSELERGDR